MSELLTDPLERPLPRPERHVIYRHTRLTRLTHWVNVLCIAVLLMSGLQIFNAHPALYWGEAGADPSEAFLEMGADESKNGSPSGFTRLGSLTFDTTGVLGLSENAAGEPSARGFPACLTLPSWRDLALGRRWHFFFAWLFAANLLIYLSAAIVSGHLRRDLLPGLQELTPRALGRDIADHFRLRFPRGGKARHYNPLQKAAYLAVVLGLLPLMVLTGLAMSPGMDAALPWLPEIFGGRQSARSIHFISAGLIAAFVFVHLLMVLLAGPRNMLRSMITGRFAISVEDFHGRA